MIHDLRGDRAGERSTLRRVEVALAESGRMPASLTYAVPAELDAVAVPGAYVTVPLGPRRVPGIVLGPAIGAPPRGLRPLAHVADGVRVPPDLLELARFAARYYGAPLTSLLRAVMPPAVRRTERRRVLPVTAEAAGAAGDAPGERASARLSPLEEKVLARLTPAGLALTALRDELGAGAIGAVRRLAARGAVVVEDVEVERRARPSGLVLAAGALERRGELSRAPQQTAVFDYVAARAPHPVFPDEIEERFPGGRRLADALARRGLLQPDAAPEPGSATGGTGADVALLAGEPREMTLHPEQAAAVAALEAAAGTFSPFLLLGVTGSGKTEVYLRVAARALERGSGVLLLVPEIGLTHQLVVQATRRFGGRVAILHSGLSDAERAAAWHDLATGRRTVAIGARSALFAPIGRLGLIVVDEEHDAAYKQEESPRYNARDLAVMRAKLAACPVVLASATPSLETYQAARTGRYRRIELTARANLAPLPAVEIVDLRSEHARDPEGEAARGGDAARQAGRRPPPVFLSHALSAALTETYRAGEQSVLFLNRRGFARFLQCEACGHVESCPDCSVSLTVHRARRAAICHHCGHARPPTALCRECGHPLEARSFGTEQIEDAARALLPAARIARLDRDTGAQPSFVRSTLAAWRAGELDVLVGTQMVAKGHDAPGVTLIGVVLADASLNFPDFRAAERTFQLIAQVAGRAGRGAKPGRVVVQTRQPEHPSLVAARGHDFAAFAEAELGARRELGYPPFGRLARIVVEGEADAAERTAEQLAQRLRAAAQATPGASPDGVAILGPAPAPIERLRGRYRHQVLVKARDSALLHRVLDAAHLGRAAPSAAAASATASAGPSAAPGPLGDGTTPRVVVDVDPIAML